MSPQYGVHVVPMHRSLWPPVAVQYTVPVTAAWLPVPFALHVSVVQTLLSLQSAGEQSYRYNLHVHDAVQVCASDVPQN